jgi:hypothetical protein
MRQRGFGRTRLVIFGVAAIAVSCGFDPAYRDYDVGAAATVCAPGVTTCAGGQLTKCSSDGSASEVVDDCGSRGLVCAAGLSACTACAPNASTCDGQRVSTCAADGSAYVDGMTCDTSNGIACRSGACQNLCAIAEGEQSNIGCEYWGADLDNAVISASLNAAAQQYAIVVSNAEADLPAVVTVEEDDSSPGSPADLRVVATATIAPRNLEVFKLGPREVDGSADGTFNTGTGTALTRHAYRVSSNVPIVAYQFNPLDNVNVFSNDASQLLPTPALGETGSAYVVAAWPQTIATTQDPTTNFGLDLRAFIAIVATRPDTMVHVQTTTRIIPGGPLTSGIDAGGSFDVLLQPFEVLNLESGGFNADFTGSTVTATGPVAVFPGSEASDAPTYSTLANRFCCADHLEEQLPPVRAVGKSYAIGRMPSRTKAIVAAGANIGVIDEPEFFRVVAVQGGITNVTTSLPPPLDTFALNAVGDTMTITAHQDFILNADAPVIIADVQASQEAAGVYGELPGGDPSLTFVPPIEQWRTDYVLLTPDKYNFDFLTLTAPTDAHLYLDGSPLDSTVCEVAPADGLTAPMRGSDTPPFLVYRCQLSFPVIDPTSATMLVSPGRQNDGVHHVQADLPVDVIAYGFDTYVSYAYAGGTQLTEINVR